MKSTTRATPNKMLMAVANACLNYLYAQAIHEITRNDTKTPYFVYFVYISCTFRVCQKMSQVTTKSALK